MTTNFLKVNGWDQQQNGGDRGKNGEFRTKQQKLPNLNNRHRGTSQNDKKANSPTRYRNLNAYAPSEKFQAYVS